MLIFNCSKAFAEFIEPKARPGIVPLVEPPPSTDPENDIALLRTSADEIPAHVQQWLVHLVRVRRKPCVLAMELNTRYAMLFTGLKKGDADAFINQLIERFANEMAFAAADAGPPRDVDTAMAKFMTNHSEFRFFSRAHRSAQAHLKEVAWLVEHHSAELGHLPEGHEECSMFDDRANRMLRKTSSSKDYFVPAEEMLIDWLRVCAGLGLNEVPRIRELFQRRNREWLSAFAAAPPAKA